MSEQLISALQQAELYPHPVKGFSVIRTHISWVILTGEHAYKIKMPMNFGFLDFTSLEQRRHYCEEELRLNRRLAPELYESLVAITGSPDSPELDGDGPVIEYAVRMKQFDQQQLLSEIDAREALSGELLDDAAAMIARFHLSLGPVDPGRGYGDPEQVMAPIRQNFEQIKAMLSDSEDLQQLELLAGWAETSYHLLEAQLRDRRDSGYVRECHGDLHLRNLTLIDNQVRAFDCIEFNEEFKNIDVINDLAFLLMDLESRNQQGLAARVLDRYLVGTGDYGGVALLNFYKSYRAVVRAKVALFQREHADEQTARALQEEYRSYVTLAESYTRIPQPFLLTMHGLSGTGKSTLSGVLLEQLQLVRLRSDVERKRMAGLEALERSGSAPGAGLYTEDANKTVYDRLAVLAVSILLAGKPVIIDGAFLKQHERDRFHRLAEDLGVGHLIVHCSTDIEFARQWVKKREEQGLDPSEAGLDVLEQQFEAQDQLASHERDHTVAVDPRLATEIRALGERLIRVLNQGVY